ncbi:hypothetical protein [Microvirga tunisiensis]|uniref:DUF2384 domain-containing protein n=1 Tax=Microvirga tunisiensis TaxID=2108360 RepID=A0A5N7MI17_9HYPH|nr:hypothetical protein [Microvirga tunisiensis]MPR06208.1 hypothetical protein [Microvirga tunisiensis]MPR26049.1 hypothetical protein [Microvirga tunisiensis]
MDDDDDQFEDALRRVRATGSMGLAPRPSVLEDLIGDTVPKHPTNSWRFLAADPWMPLEADMSDGRDAMGDGDEKETFGEALREMGWTPTTVYRRRLIRRGQPFNSAIAEADAIKNEILRRAGGYLEEALAADWLCMDVAELRQHVEAGDLLAVEWDGRLVVPAFQLRNSMTVLRVREILAMMPIRAPWMRLEWFVTPDDALGGLTPFEAFQAGREAEVRELARGHGAD